MAICKKIRIKKRELCIGDLKHSVEFLNRPINTPTSGSVDYSLPFTPLVGAPIKAALETPEGVFVFDGTNQDRAVSHIWYVRFFAAITTEIWLKFDGNLFDLLKVNNMEERGKWLKIMSNLRGPDTRKPNAT